MIIWVLNDEKGEYEEWTEEELEAFLNKEEEEEEA